MDFDINKLLDLDKFLDDGAIIVIFVEKKLVDESPDYCWTDHISRRAHITVVDGVCIQHRWGKPGQKYDPEDTQKLANDMGQELIKIHYL